MPEIPHSFGKNTWDINTGELSFFQTMKGVLLMGNKIARKNVEDIFALTSLQQGMLFHYLKDTGSSEYIEQLSLRLKGTIDAGAIKRAWNHVAQCNEMLRTVYKWEKLETPVQVVQREYEVPVKYVELSERDEAGKIIKEIREKDKAEGTDISAEPFRNCKAW